MKLNKYINTGQTEFFGNRKLFPRCVRISVILISDALEGAKGLDPHCHLKSLDMKHRVTASGVSKYDALPKREVIVLTTSREITKFP